MLCCDQGVLKKLGKFGSLVLAWTTKIYSKETQIHGFIFKQDIKYRKYCKYKFNVITIEDEGTSVRPVDASDCVDFVITEDLW